MSNRTLDVVSGIVTLILLSAFVVQSMNVSRLKKEAVKAGAAYWKVNEDSGGTTFIWKHLEKSKNIP